MARWTMSEESQTARGAAEEATGAPLTETEAETSQRPASDPGDSVSADAEVEEAAAEEQTDETLADMTPEDEEELGG